jgi:hypothetical protein
MATNVTTAPETPAAAAAPTTAAPLAAFAGVRRIPTPINDPNRSYAPGSPERAELKARLKTMAGERIDIPLVIGGKEIRTGKTATSVMPHDHARAGRLPPRGDLPRSSRRSPPRPPRAASGRPGRGRIAPPCS